MDYCRSRYSVFGGCTRNSPFFLGQHRNLFACFVAYNKLDAKVKIANFTAPANKISPIQFVKQAFQRMQINMDILCSSSCCLLNKIFIYTTQTAANLSKIVVFMGSKLYL